MTDPASPGMRRRDLLSLIGAAAGGTAMYQAMTSLGLAAESPYRGPIRLEGDPKGASVIILGAGLAGMTAAYELGRAGYKVEILEYNSRPGGRNWTIRGGDVYAELGGAVQRCAFDDGLYLNPGPWRIPYHHHAILDYCRRFGVALEPFIQLNHNAYLHATEAFGGRPQRIREIKADFEGAIAELLAKATRQGALDEAVSKEDQEILLEALRSHGGLDKDFRYQAGDNAADFRGYARDPGGGLAAAPSNGEPIGLHDLLTSRLWRGLQNFALYDFQTTMFQPVGGMGRIGEAFARQIPNVIRYGAKVTAIQQDDHGVAVVFEDLNRGGSVEEGEGGLVRLRIAALDPEPDRRQRLRADEGGDRRRPLCVGGQDRTAVPAPLLGGGRADFWRHFLHRPAHPPDLVSELRLQCRGQGRAARRLYLGRAEFVRTDRNVAGRPDQGRARLRR